MGRGFDLRGGSFFGGMVVLGAYGKREDLNRVLRCEHAD